MLMLSDPTRFRVPCNTSLPSINYALLTQCESRAIHTTLAVLNQFLDIL